MMRKWELEIYYRYKFGIVSSMPWFGISKGSGWNVTKYIQLSCHIIIH